MVGGSFGSEVATAAHVRGDRSEWGLGGVGGSFVGMEGVVGVSFPSAADSSEAVAWGYSFRCVREIGSLH